MRPRDEQQGYGRVAKLLHWTTVIVLVGQFTIGYTMSQTSAQDAAIDRAEDRLDAFEDRMADQAEAQGEEAEERFEIEIERREDELKSRDDNFVADAVSGLASGEGFRDGLNAPELHILLGTTVLLLGVIRVAWRRRTGLPPWADFLTERERTLQAWLEKAMLSLLFIVPGTGLALLAVGDDWLPVHVTVQVTLIIVVALHVGLVLKHTVLRRDGQLLRMLR